MANVSELRLVPNFRGTMSLIYNGRSYRLKHTGKRNKYWRCSKDREGCKGVVWTDLNVTQVIRQKDHMRNCPMDQP
ncbi:hypothetical protein T01_14754 [Trichinella spiralis]|uniref:FLYWCH-type domain-containing protein n=1 Tax=Trichinella spiralis TaxID=6334 RepID=A0A0V1BNR4_TRISP|nr:hypothetical protein T01_14754 [Trichinella spiralis]